MDKGFKEAKTKGWHKIYLQPLKLIDAVQTKDTK